METRKSNKNHFKMLVLLGDMSAIDGGLLEHGVILEHGGLIEEIR
jgi:hypothetical protein